MHVLGFPSLFPLSSGILPPSVSPCVSLEWHQFMNLETRQEVLFILGGNIRPSVKEHIKQQQSRGLAAWMCCRPCIPPPLYR